MSMACLEIRKKGQWSTKGPTTSSDTEVLTSGEGEGCDATRRCGVLRERVAFSSNKSNVP